MFLKNLIRSSVGQWMIATIPPVYLCFLAPMETAVETGDQHLGAWVPQQVQSAYNDVFDYFSNAEQPKPEPKPAAPTFEDVVWQFLDENQMMIFNVVVELVLFEMARYAYNNFVKVFFGRNKSELILDQRKF